MPSAGKAVTVVAHPDDCVIFALPLIENCQQFNWHIIYLTYNEKDARAREVKNFWHNRNVSTEFLDFRDDYLDQQTQKLNFWTQTEAEAAIGYAVAQHDPVLALTHNSDGDYGHIHHRIVHNAVNLLGVPKIYFASTFNLTDTYLAHDYDLDSLPLHREVIEGFADRLIGRYIVSDDARHLL